MLICYYTSVLWFGFSCYGLRWRLLVTCLIGLFGGGCFKVDVVDVVSLWLSCGLVSCWWGYGWAVLVAMVGCFA